MVTIQEVVARRQALEQAKQGMRRERIQQVKEQFQRGIKNIRQANYKKTFTTPKSKGQIPSKKTQSAFLKMFAGIQPKSKGSRSVGRPRQVYIHRSPITGKPIPAQVYNKEMRFIRRRQSDIATQRQLQIQQHMARQGVSPQQAQMIELQRQLQARQTTKQVITRPMPSQAQIQTQEMPQAGRIQPPQARTIWNRSGGGVFVEPDLMGNMKPKVYGRPESFFN